MTELEEFTTACLEALYFTDTGEEGQPSREADMEPDTLLNLQADCRSWWRRFGYFVLACREQMPDAIKAAGHDFWFTRNGHGVGFWDGDWKSTPYEDLFTEGARAYGPFETYLDDSGRIAA